MNNLPEVRLGIVAVSRDCFTVSLSDKRRKNVVAECKKKKVAVIDIETVIENEKDVLKALKEIESKKVNALVVFLGNFGPEGPLSMLAQKFNKPVMLCAAAEETQEDLINGRGDAYCGMLNAAYNFKLRKIIPYIPEYPVGTAPEIADKISEFIPVARVMLGLKKLKIFSFGPRPQDFVACNAPIKALYDMGIEIMENSELDLLDVYRSAEKNKNIPAIARDMAKELGTKGNTYPDLLTKLAQYEAGLLKFMENNLGASEYGIFANKCWPSFEKYFMFTPCYVNSRLAARGIPVSCEVDIYGTLSEYMITLATGLPATLLDINNSVPYDMIKSAGNKIKMYKPDDVVMCFHCGNTPSSCMLGFSLKYQLIMHRLMEPGNPPDITRGTLEGRIKPGDVTLFRIQSSADTALKCYVAEGEVLDIDPKSFGSIGVFAVKEMGRFYRHVLIGNQFPHHAGVGFKHTAKALFSAVKMLGIEDVYWNLPKGQFYKDENPF